MAPTSIVLCPVAMVKFGRSQNLAVWGWRVMKGVKAVEGREKTLTALSRIGLPMSIFLV